METGTRRIAGGLTCAGCMLDISPAFRLWMSKGDDVWSRPAVVLAIPRAPPPPTERVAVMGKWQVATTTVKLINSKN